MMEAELVVMKEGYGSLSFMNGAGGSTNTFPKSCTVRDRQSRVLLANSQAVPQGTSIPHAKSSLPMNAPKRNA